MEEVRTGPRVILHASFIAQEPNVSTHLMALEKMGCVLVLLDSLSYELCAAPMKDQWLHVQRKLMHCPDVIEYWVHADEMRKNEIDLRLPTCLPVDNYATSINRHWLRLRQEFVPDNVGNLAKLNRKQEAVDTVRAIVADIETKKSELDDLAYRLWKKPPDQTSEICFRFVNDRPRIIAQLLRSHGNANDPKRYIPACATTVNERWFVFHQAKSYLALLCHHIQKYGTKVTPESIKDIEDTVVECEYAASLAFAEGLAYSETKTDLWKLCQWMYGGSRKLITMAQIDKVLPQPLDIEKAAYYRWETWGHKHGQDIEQWHLAERELHRFLWPIL